MGSVKHRISKESSKHVLSRAYQKIERLEQEIRRLQDRRAKEKDKDIKTLVEFIRETEKPLTREVENVIADWFEREVCRSNGNGTA